MTDDGSLSLLHPTLLECFHSKGGARQEAHFLYIEASGVAAPFSLPGQVRILDIGLGLGYNAMATIQAFTEAIETPASMQVPLQNRTLDLVSLEWDGQLIEQLRTGSAIWQQGWSEDWVSWCQALQKVDKIPSLLSHEPNIDDQVVFHATIVPAAGGKINWYVMQGDALKVAPRLRSGFQYIWQDPFSPKSNPPLWTDDWFRSLFLLADHDCTLMTYSVAGAVRRSLESAGWYAQKIPGQGSKRQWLRARADKCGSVSGASQSESR
jgi:tRNA 5-methylaminomethyl-2-thiouridine biosynthesis bifunctional protein